MERSPRSAPRRLGLTAAVAAPLGEDVAGDLVRALLADEGVSWIGTKPAPRTPTTVVMPFGGDRAMVTIDPGARASATDVAGASPRAVAASLDQLYVVPEGVPAYVTCGDDDARAYAGRPPAALEGVRAFFVNQREVLGLTGQGHGRGGRGVPRRARRHGRRHARSRGRDRTQRRRVREPLRSSPSTSPADTTGAGDLLTAAYIWADLNGAELADRLRWAVLYASLAVDASRPGSAGRSPRPSYCGRERERGLTPPPGAGS